MNAFVNFVTWEASKMTIIFLMICLLYIDYRDNLFNSITCFVIKFNEMSNNDEFQYINKNHQKGLAKFLTFYKIVGKDGMVS